MKRLIFYDLDGTLVDTRRDILLAANHMRSHLGLPPLPDGEIRQAVGLGLKKLVERCLGTADPGRVEEGTRIYRSYYTQHLLDHTALYPSALKALKRFKDRLQAVVTNKPDPYSRRILSALGVEGYFRDIVAGNSGYAKKPDPASLLSILERENIAPREALLVGDSPIDVETGARAGVFTVAVTHGFSTRSELESAGPDRIVEHFEEFLDRAGSERW